MPPVKQPIARFQWAWFVVGLLAEASSNLVTTNKSLCNFIKYHARAAPPRRSYYNSAFYFAAGGGESPAANFHLATTGLTYLNTTLAKQSGVATNAGPTQFSAYRIHEQDPLLFENSAQLLMRNGTLTHWPRSGGGRTGSCRQPRPQLPQRVGVLVPYVHAGGLFKQKAFSRLR